MRYRYVLQYNIKKKEEVDAMQMEPDNPLMRKKKTPEELEKEAEMADQDELTSESNSGRCGAGHRDSQRQELKLMRSGTLTHNFFV